MDALRAALANGADAVYLGASLFGARASVGFDEETLKDAVALSHLHKRRVHVTVNTLVKNAELSDVRRTFAFLESIRADAVLVQDAGAMKICLTEFPSLAVHASTQMTVHNAYGAVFLRDLGVRRVVLARECDIDAIRRVARTGIETEVFAHGALCVSVSGQCLFSSMIGGRSGNRGRCAQPCRLPYSFGGKPGAWLSPRDLCVRDRLPELIGAGAASLKIEGRLKRPEYVAVVTRAYRDALDAALEGRFSPADANEKRALQQIFCRGGFTEGRAFGKEDAAVIDPARVKPAGVSIGQITRVREHRDVFLCDARLSLGLNDGDGLEIGDQTVRYAGNPVPSGQTATLRMRARPRVGDDVRRTDDEGQLRAARASCEGDAFDRALPIRLSARLTAYPGKPLALALTDGEITVAREGDLCRSAETKPLDADAAARSLCKTGGTPYIIRDIALDTANAFAPAAALNALRRDALEAMTTGRIAAYAPAPQALAASAIPRAPASARLPDRPSRDRARPMLYVQTHDLSEASALRGAGADRLIAAPRDLRPAQLLQTSGQIQSFEYLALPPFCGDEALEALAAFAGQHGIGLCLQNIGQFPLAAETNCILGESIPLTNAESLSFFASLGARAATLSRELSFDEARAFDAALIPLILPVYGRTRLMLLKHCPYRAANGLSDGHAACARCFSGEPSAPLCLNDRFGNKLPLIPQKLPDGCVNALYSHQITDLSDQPTPDGVSYLISLTDETPDERLRVVRAFRDKLDGEPAPRGARFIGRYAEGVQ